MDPDQLVVHADRGAAMTCKTVAQLMVDLRSCVATAGRRCPTTTRSREASFKTLKYDPTFPPSFGSVQHARQHCEGFYNYYNHEHRHSGVGLHTPASVHYGTATEIRAQRP